MPVLKYYSRSYLKERALSSDVLVIVQDVSQSAEISSSLGFTQPNSELVRLAFSRLRPGLENASTTEFLVIEKEELIKVVLAMLPPPGSRHNAPSRPHSVTRVVQSLNVEKDLLIILAPSCPEHMLAQGVAIARALPEYSKKMNKSKTSERKVSVVLHHPAISSDMDPKLVEVSNLAESIMLCQRLVDLPPNELHTDSYVTICEQVVEELQSQEQFGSAITTIKVIRGEELEKQGFGGIWVCDITTT